MDDQGWVSIKTIAGFNKVSWLGYLMVLSYFLSKLFSVYILFMILCFCFLIKCLAFDFHCMLHFFIFPFLHL